MSDAASVEISKAVTSLVNSAALSGALGLAFTATRGTYRDVNLADASTLQVFVVNGKTSGSVLDRARDEYDYETHVVVRQRVALLPPAVGLDQPRIDQLVRLIEQIDDLFRHKPLALVPTVHWRKSDQPLPADCDPRRLEQHSEFFSVLTITFRKAR